MLDFLSDLLGGSSSTPAAQAAVAPATITGLAAGIAAAAPHADVAT